MPNQKGEIIIMDKKYSITLADGTELSSLALNGNNFISTVPLNESTFRDNCSPVVISNGETSVTHENMELVQVVQQFPGEWWFVLRDLSQEELVRMKTQSDIEYIAMMAGIEL